MNDIEKKYSQYSFIKPANEAFILITDKLTKQKVGEIDLGDLWVDRIPEHIESYIKWNDKVI